MKDIYLLTSERRNMKAITKGLIIGNFLPKYLGNLNFEVLILEQSVQMLQLLL